MSDVTEGASANPGPKRSRRRENLSRRRAWLTMRVLTAACVVAGLAIGASQLASGGLQAFLSRPPGVGATPASTSTSQQANASRPAASGAPAGSRTSASPPPTPPTPDGRRRARRRRDDAPAQQAPGRLGRSDPVGHD